MPSTSWTRSAGTATTAWWWRRPHAGRWPCGWPCFTCRPTWATRYAARNGLERRDYTREELAIGASWRFGGGWRAYGETGVAWVLRSDEQEPWRVQGGLEWEGTPRLWGGRFSWYGAVDLASMQERGWRLDAAVEGGILTRSSGRAVRLLVQFYDGRPTLGEFFLYHEAHLTLGIRMDL